MTDPRLEVIVLQQKDILSRLKEIEKVLRIASPKIVWESRFDGRIQYWRYKREICGAPLEIWPKSQSKSWLSLPPPVYVVEHERKDLLIETISGSEELFSMHYRDLFECRLAVEKYIPEVERECEKYLTTS